MGTVSERGNDGVGSEISKSVFEAYLSRLKMLRVVKIPSNVKLDEGYFVLFFYYIFRKKNVFQGTTVTV